MAHFAFLDSSNIVTNVIVVNNDVITDDKGVEQEQLGIDFLNNLYGFGNWYKQTSYNNNFRKNYASIGFRYDPDKDAFIKPQPFTSWTLNESTCQWEAPVAYPDASKKYLWNEATTNWVEVT
jgi:hypothetical protein